MVVSVLIIVLSARVAYLLVFKGYVWPEWTGFGEFTVPNDRYQRAKTLWDLLELLIVPAVLGIGALLFNKATRGREQEIVEDQQREEVLQNYLDKMAELLLKEKLSEQKDNLDDPVVGIAQIRTVTTLRILDTGRKNVLFQFLRDANLSDFVLMKASFIDADLSGTNIPDINLSEANLSGANLISVDLGGANLRGAKLTRANLSRANLTAVDLLKADLGRAVLSGAILASANLYKAHLGEVDLDSADLRSADLSKANLRRANVTWADMSAADLHEADLRNANLSRAILWQADLSGANLSGANLRDADLEGASLSEAKYNRQTQWPEDFDYENSGAIFDYE